MAESILLPLRNHANTSMKCCELAIHWVLQVMKLGDPRPSDGAEVSALGFSPAGNLLGVGHANGDVAFWELRHSGWECVKTVKGAAPPLNQLIA